MPESLAKVSLNKLVSFGSELFASTELELADKLSQEVLGDIKVTDGEMVLVVAIDRNEPTKLLVDADIVLRFNLRFYPPTRTVDGTPIGLEPKDWSERLQKALEDAGIQYELGGVAQLVKATLFLPVLEIPSEAILKPEEEEPAAEEPAAEEPAAEDGEEPTQEEEK